MVLSRKTIETDGEKILLEMLSFLKTGGGEPPFTLENEDMAFFIESMYKSVTSNEDDNKSLDDYMREEMEL